MSSKSLKASIKSTPAAENSSKKSAPAVAANSNTRKQSKSESTKDESTARARCQCSRQKPKSEEPPEAKEELLKKFDPYTTEVQQASTAILLVDSTETNVAIDSLNALQVYCKKADDNKEEFVKLGGLTALHRHMFDENTAVQRISMKLMSIVATVQPAKAFLVNEIKDCTKDLLKLAQSSDDVVVEYATSILSNVATLFTGREQIINNEGLPVLMKLLSHSDPDIQMNALETVWQIAADPFHICPLCTKENVEPIMKLVDSEYPPLQAVALMTLEKIAQIPEGLDALESLNIAEILVNKLTNETMVDLHRHCLKLLCHLCRDKRSCKKFAYLVPVIVDLIERTPDLLAKINGIELLGRLSSVGVVAKGLAESGIPNHLLTILESPDSDLPLKEACAFVAAQITRSPEIPKKEFAKLLPVLTQMVEDGNLSPKAHEHCLVAISNILEGYNICKCKPQIKGLVC